MSLHGDDYKNAAGKAVAFLRAHPSIEYAAIVFFAFVLGRCTA